MRVRVAGLLLLISVAAGVHAASEVPYLVRDLPDPHSLCAAGDRLLFFAEDQYGRVIGRSNGAHAGTTTDRVGVIDPYFAQWLVGAGNRCYAMLTPELYGKYKLASTDGTEAGSELLSSDVGSVVAFGEGILFKELSDDSIRYSDGTAAGTRVVQTADGFPRLTDWVPYAANGRAWFVRFGMLAVSDGTEGPRNVPLPAAGIGTIREVVAGPNATYFVEADFDFAISSPVSRLWRTDGTADGTSIVKSFPDVVLPTGVTFSPRRFVHTTEKLFFEYNRVAWATDGTEANTVALPAPGMENYCYRGNETAVVGKDLFWYGRETGETYSLWKSDGTVEGTIKLATFPRSMTNCLTMAAFGERVYFLGTDVSHGAEPWVSDGTVDGTHMVADVFPGVQGSEPRELNIAAGHLFFTAETQDRGRELWAIGERGQPGQPRRRAAGH